MNPSPDTTGTIVGDLVRRRRATLGWSQRDLSRLAAVSCKTLHTLETGSRWPQKNTRHKVETALGWSPDSLEYARVGHPPTVVDGWQPPTPPTSAPKPGIGATVRRRRIELGITHAELAAMVGLNQDSISQIEANEFIPGQPYHPGFDEALQWPPGTLASRLPDSDAPISMSAESAELVAIGQRVSRQRKLRGMTQADLAAHLGVSRRAIIDIEADRHPPRPRLRVLIEQALCWPQGALLLPDRD